MNDQQFWREVSQHIHSHCLLGKRLATVKRCSAAIGAGRLRKKPILGGQAAMEFLHRVDRIAEVFEGVVRPEYADLTVPEWPAIVEVGGDLATMQID